MDIQAYFHRMGMAPITQATAENLALLTRAHLEAVPFENLLIHTEGQIPSLESEDLFEKIVKQHRGGYCFELNKLFCLLLTELGYSCTSVAVRIVHHREEPRPISHRATVVSCEGRLWFVDVGYGGAGPKGILCMDTDAWQQVAGDSFRILQEGSQYVICRLTKGIEERVMVFRNEPWLDGDFQMLNGYYALFPTSPFRTRRVVYRCIPDGWINLTDNLFTISHQGTEDSREIPESQIPALLQEQFGIILPGRNF